MKQKLRDAISKKRSKLSKEEVLTKSKKVLDSLTTLTEYKTAKNVLFYVSVRQEVFTHELIKVLLRTKEKKVIVPFTAKEEGSVQISLLEDFNDLEPQNFGILEPKNEKRKSFDTDKIDLIIVPGVAFDKTGHRIGYGHGHYDRFLKTLQHKPVKVGIAYDFQIVENFHEEPHDIPVDIIVSESEVIRVR